MPFPKRASKGSSSKSPVSQGKAKEIMRHGEVRGHELTPKQKGFFGARAGGAPMMPAPRNPPGRKGRRG
jgi:hypothetical protein